LIGDGNDASQTIPLVVRRISRGMRRMQGISDADRFSSQVGARIF